MKTIKVYCDLCGELKGENVKSETDVLNKVISLKDSHLNFEMHICDKCLENLKNKSENIKNKILNGARRVTPEVKSVNDVNKEKTIKALNTLYSNYITKGSICKGIHCTEAKCPFNKYDSCPYSQQEEWRKEDLNRKQTPEQIF